MQIDDTFVVTQAVELPEVETGQQLASQIAEAVKGLTQNASAFVAKERQQHRVFALSVTPLIVPYGDKRFLSVTVVVAIVPKNVVSNFPWAPRLTS